MNETKHLKITYAAVFQSLGPVSMHSASVLVQMIVFNIPQGSTVIVFEYYEYINGTIL